jgi:hypothetical protein
VGEEGTVMKVIELAL